MTRENIYELKQIYKEIIQNTAQREKVKNNIKETLKVEWEGLINQNSRRRELRERQKAIVKEIMMGNLQN